MELEADIESYIKRQLLEPQGRGGEIFTRQTSLFREAVVDSFGLLSLIFFLEAKFGIPVRDEDMVPENFDNIGSIADFVTRRRAAIA